MFGRCEDCGAAGHEPCVARVDGEDIVRATWHAKRRVRADIRLPEAFDFRFLTPTCYLLFHGTRYLGRLERGLGVETWCAHDPAGRLLTTGRAGDLPRLTQSVLMATVAIQGGLPSNREAA